MLKPVACSIFLLLFSLSHSAAHCQIYKTTSVGVGTNFLGLGGHLAWNMSNEKPSSVIRIAGGINTVELPEQSFNFNQVPVSANTNFKTGGIGLFYDFHPFHNAFKIVTGLLYSMHNFSANVNLKDTYNIGEIPMSPEEIGTISASIKPSKVLPYVGLGFGNCAPTRKRISISFEIGTFYSTANNVTLNCGGLIEPMNEQESIIENNLSDYRWIPNTNLTINFRLFP